MNVKSLASALVFLSLGIAAGCGTLWELWYFGGIAFWLGGFLGFLIFALGLGIWPGVIAYLCFAAAIQALDAPDHSE